MTTLLLIIAACAFIAVGVLRLVAYLSYSEKEEERTPVENYDLFKPTKTKIKKQKLKTKK
jgi:hypothetical protein